MLELVQIFLLPPLFVLLLLLSPCSGGWFSFIDFPSEFFHFILRNACFVLVLRCTRGRVWEWELFLQCVAASCFGKESHAFPALLWERHRHNLTPTELFWFMRSCSIIMLMIIVEWFKSGGSDWHYETSGRTSITSGVTPGQKWVSLNKDSMVTIWVLIWILSTVCLKNMNHNSSLVRCKIRHEFDEFCL